MRTRIHERTPHLDIPLAVHRRRALPSWPEVRLRVVVSRAVGGLRQLDVRRIPGSLRALPLWVAGGGGLVRLQPSPLVRDGSRLAWEWWEPPSLLRLLPEGSDPVGGICECPCWYGGACGAGHRRGWTLCEGDRRKGGSRFLYLVDGWWRCAPCAAVVTAREAALRLVGKARLSKWRCAIREGHVEAVEGAAGGAGPESLAAQVALELEGAGGLDILPADLEPGWVPRRRRPRGESPEEALVRYLAGGSRGRTVGEMAGYLRRAGHGGASPGWVRLALGRLHEAGRAYEQGCGAGARWWSPPGRVP